MSYKFCPMCGEKVANELFKFCPECGFKFDSLDETIENNSQDLTNSQVEIEKGELLAKDPKLRQKQIELAKKYNKNLIDSTDNADKNANEDNAKMHEAFNSKPKKTYDPSKPLPKSKYAGQKGPDLSKNKRYTGPKYKGNIFLNTKKEEESVEREKLKQQQEENSSCYGNFSCHYSEKRYSTLIGVYPEFFNGVCTIYKNRLVIQGKKRQKVIRFSNISSMEYNRSFFRGSGMVITLSGGNIIELTIGEDAYFIINKLWSQGNY